MNTEPNPFASPTSNVDGGETAAGLRPNSPQVIGILSIVFGSLGLLMGAWGLIVLSGMIAFFRSSAFSADMMYGSGYTATMTIVGLITSLALLIAGIGLVKYRHWGRNLFFAYAAATILMQVGSAAYMIFFALPIMGLEGTEFEGSGVDVTFMKTSMYLGAFIGAFGGCLYPVICLVFLLPRRVAAWMS